ncbi:MAG TPA: hypothetical protein VLR49_00155 [Ferruginibacter sp.]|nr:hypothetical protein [Ferruginibacter sp.]
MKFTFCPSALLLSMMLLSCNNNKEDSNTENIDTKKTEPASLINNDISAIERDSIFKILQGKWKESEYPFRQVQFTNTSVKFIEEGVQAEPTFKEYNISRNCPYKVNNIKNAGTNEMFLVMVEAGTCEILKTSNNTLTLSGFNVSTNSGYNIIYKKLE